VGVWVGVRRLCCEKETRKMCLGMEGSIGR
jgi:hypothetical protein